MIKIVIGKPGTGKTYHTVKFLAEYIKIQAKKTTPRKIYTNISLNLEALEEYCKFYKIDYNVRENIHLLKNEDLTFSNKFLKPDEVKKERRGAREYITVSPVSLAYFWNRIPDRALIIIDEIQKYIGSIKEYGESERQSLVEYFSLHRHKKHDWIFLTQSLMSLSVEVRRVSEQVDEVFNVKSLTLPFPLSIPVADIFTVLRAFGVKTQVYRVRSGILTNSYKVDYEGPLEVVKMSTEIFKLYQTHTLIKEEDSDSISRAGEEDLPYDLGRGAWRRALWWFFKKHVVHISLKVAIGLIIAVFGHEVLFNWGSYVLPKKEEEASKDITEDKKEVEFVDPVLSKFSDKKVEELEVLKPIIIKEGAVFINGKWIKEGTLISPGVVVGSIDPFNGIEYYDEEIYFKYLLSAPFNYARWLRIVEEVDRSDSVLSTE